MFLHTFILKTEVVVVKDRPSDNRNRCPRLCSDSGLLTFFLFRKNYFAIDENGKGNDVLRMS